MNQTIVLERWGGVDPVPEGGGMSAGMRSLVLLAVACGPGPAPEPAAPPAPFAFAVVGDRTDEPKDLAWRQILGDVGARRPDLLLTVGDLADDALDPTDWDQALAPTATMTAPVAYTPGNHDILDDATAAYFEERTGQAPYRSFDQGGVHFVVVDNSIAETWETLPEAQRVWLEADLAAHGDGPLVVSMHKPFWALGAAVGEPDPMHDLFVRSGVDAVFTGHWHAHLYQRVDGIDYVGVGTSGGAYGGLQDARRGNAYEYAWAEVRDGTVSVRMVAGGTELPVDYVTRADHARLRELRNGAFVAVSRGNAIEVRIRNLHDVPITGALTVDPGTWTVTTPELEVSIAPGETFTASIPVTRGAPLFPSPRVRLDYPLPDAGIVPFEVPVDVVREVAVPRGSAVLDGDLAEWEGGSEIGPFTTALGLPATTEATSVRVRHDDAALYFAARCAESEPGSLRRNHAGPDGQVVYDDRIGFVLWPAADHLVWFYVNPNGAVWDLQRVGAVLDRAWNGVEAVASVDATGWTVEARVPFAAMGLAEVPKTWAFDVRRRQERTQTEATFTSSFWNRDPARIGALRLVP